MHKAVRLIGVQDHVLMPVDPEQTTMRVSYRIVSDRIKAGKLHVSVDPGLRMQDMTPLIAMTLTGRAVPLSPSAEDSLASMDVARDWIVRCFAATTTDASHQEWERYE
jgi:hypothetical protein